MLETLPAPQDDGIAYDIDGKGADERCGAVVAPIECRITWPLED